MSRKRRLRRGALVLHLPGYIPPLPEARPGPERYRLPSREIPSSPFAEALKPLRWKMQRTAASSPQPPMPRRWR